MKNKILLIQKLKAKMAFNDAHRNLASKIALYLSKKESDKATRISSIYVELVNSVGPNNAMKLIMHYVEQIRAGVNNNYSGCHMFDKGSIHAMKQKLINTLYDRLVRELVMPIIYAYYKTEIKPGAFAAMLVIPEDKDRLHGPIESDLSVAKELKLKDLIDSVKYEPGVAQQIKNALRLGNLDDFEINEDQLDNSDGGFVSDNVPDFDDYYPPEEEFDEQDDQDEEDDEPDYEDDPYEDEEDVDERQEEIHRNYLHAAQNQEIEIPPKDKEEADEEFDEAVKEEQKRKRNRAPASKKGPSPRKIARCDDNEEDDE